MPIPENTQSAGEYLKASNVKNGDFVKFLSPHVVEISKDYGPQDVITVSFNGEDKKIRLNNPSYQSLSPHYGLDTDNWVGKSAVITIVDYSSKGYKPGIVLMPCIEAPKETAEDPKKETLKEEEIVWDE